MMKLALCVVMEASILEVSGDFSPDESPYGFRFENTRLDLLDLLGLERFVFDQDSRVDPREVKIVRCQEVRVTREL